MLCVFCVECENFGVTKHRPHVKQLDESRAGKKNNVCMFDHYSKLKIARKAGLGLVEFFFLWNCSLIKIPNFLFEKSST